MRAWHCLKYRQAARHAPGWPPPSPSPSGGGISCSLSRLRERVRVRVLLTPAHLCSVPSGLLSFPLWGKVGMGAGHGLKHQQVVWDASGWPPPSPSPSGGGKKSPSPLPSPTSGRGSKGHPLSRLRERVRVRGGVLLPPLGEGRDGGQHLLEQTQSLNHASGCAPTLALPQRGRDKTRVRGMSDQNTSASLNADCFWSLSDSTNSIPRSGH